MYKYVLFDLDGTLTDSAEGITKCVQFALMQQGIMETDLTKLEKFIGPPLTDSFIKYYGLDMERADKAVWDFRKRYEPVGIFENRTYDGIPQMLSSLKDAGVKLLVASSKPEVFVYKVLERFEIKQYFDIIAGASDDEKGGTKEAVMQQALWMLVDLLDGKKISVSKARKNPESDDGRSREDLEEAMDRHHISKSSCAMVGDTMYDINAAKEFGLSAIGVGYGFASEGELESSGADVIVENPEELLTVLIGSSGSNVKKKLNVETGPKNIPHLRICLFSGALALFLNILFNITGLIRISVSFSETSAAQASTAFGTGIILYGLIMPIVEELIFRWLIFGRLKKIFNIYIAVFVSAVFFGVYHGNLVQGLYAFPMGMVFAIMYHKTGKFYIPVMMHGVANALVFSLMSDQALFQSLNTPVHCIVFGLVVLTSGLGLYKTYK